MSTLWTNDHREWYRTAYLHSEHWKALRASKFNANPSCERCGARATDVHHVNYRNILDVTLADLLSLCRPCHEEEHRINGMPMRPKPKFFDDFDRERHERDQAKIATHFQRKAKKAACNAARRNRVWSKEEKKLILDQRRMDAKTKKGKRPRLLFGRELVPA